MWPTLATTSQPAPRAHWIFFVLFGLSTIISFIGGLGAVWGCRSASCLGGEGVRLPDAFYVWQECGTAIRPRTRPLRWRTAVRGYFAYHAVPTNSKCLGAFRHYAVDLWRRSLIQRSQRDRTTWNRIAKLAAEFLPLPRILHPWPSVRFAVKHPRWEPGA
jgi:hypothetical protein